MLSMRRLIFTALALLLLSSRANAFFFEGNNSHNRGTSTSFTTTPPTGTFNVGDVILLTAACTQGTSGITDLAISNTPSGTWTIAVPTSGGTAGNNINFQGTNGAFAAWWHVYAGTETTWPVFNSGGNSVTCAWTMMPIFGANTTAPIDAYVGSANGASNQTISFPSVTPSAANDELLLIGVGNYGASPAYSINGANSSGQLKTCTGSAGVLTDIWLPNTGITSGNPDMGWWAANQGPCAPTATTATSITTTATAARNMGVSMLIASAPIVTAQPAYFTNLQHNGAGLFDLDSYYQGRASVSSTHMQPWLDGFTTYIDWHDIEPNACDEYFFDYVDNQILNAEVLGKKTSLGIAAGSVTPCGGTGQASCTGFNDVTNTPPWVFQSNTCTNSHAMVNGTDYVTSIWVRGGGPPDTSPVEMFDPSNQFYQHAWSRAIGDFGSRWGGIKNVTNVYNTGGNQGVIVEVWDYNHGQDGTAISCNGTAAQCNSISQDADWPGTSQTVALNHIILPTASSNNTACSGNPCVFKATTGGTTSASTQPTWSSCTSTCTDGSVVWTNQNAFTKTVNDGTGLWLTLTDSGGHTYSASNTNACGANNQSFTTCDTLAAAETFAGDWHAAFPNARVIWAHQAGNGGGSAADSCPGCYTWSGSPSVAQDPFMQGAFTFNKTTDAGIAGELDAAAGCNNVVATCPINQLVTYLPYGNQPFDSIAFQEVTATNNNTAACNGTGRSHYWSIGLHNCTIPEINNDSTNPGILNIVKYPYLEAYLATLQNSQSVPWFMLFHQFAIGPQPPPGQAVFPGGASIPVSQFSSQLGNALTQPGTFETGHP